MREPFGGKQLLLVGDIFQLEPVIKEEEWRLMQPFYASAYFFSAKVWQEMQLVSIELRKVYRQSDSEFIAILDRIRENQATDHDLAAIPDTELFANHLHEILRLRWLHVAIPLTGSTSRS